MTAAARRRHNVARRGEDHRWWSTYTSWVVRQRGHHDAYFNTCVSQGSSQTVSSWLVLGRVIRRVDTDSHTQQPLITVGDVTFVDHFVK